MILKASLGDRQANFAFRGQGRQGGSRPAPLQLTEQILEMEFHFFPAVLFDGRARLLVRLQQSQTD